MQMWQENDFSIIRLRDFISSAPILHIYKATIDDDGDLALTCPTAPTVFIRNQPQSKSLTLFGFLPLRSDASSVDKLRFVNKRSWESPLIRCACDLRSNDLFIAYTMLYVGGMEEEQLLRTLWLFVDLFWTLPEADEYNVLQLS